MGMISISTKKKKKEEIIIIQQDQKRSGEEINKRDFNDLPFRRKKEKYEKNSDISISVKVHFIIKLFF